MKAAMPLLTFEGRAFEALEYYKEVFHHFDIIQLVNYTVQIKYSSQSLELVICTND